MFVVVATGAAALMQDQGRPGMASLGVTRSGAFDTVAAALANRLVGNPESAAVIEALGGGLALRTDDPAIVAVTGATGPVHVDGRAVARNATLTLRGDTHIELGAPSRGVRSYVAVRGGFAVRPVLGSRSYDTLGHLGPEPLQIGDWLPVGPATMPAAPVDHAPAPGSELPVALSIAPGPRRDWFTDSTWDTLLTSAWQVQPSSNRVGIRLGGPRLARTATRVDAELPPEGLIQGAIQVPPDGQPIIMGPDHPTTGGYPVIAVVAPADCAHCAQLVPGDSVHLRAILFAGR